ncbi:MAG: YdeI/OmpD-associated family protein [Chloroflexi bacterium]|nr:YdeI/OmpD-associated family protein [Chloroflexota bacterium]
MEYDLPVISFATQAEFAAWLADNHASSRGILLKLAKKVSRIPSVTYAEAVEAALCYGWIDGRKDPLDATHWLQRFTPRRPRSPWSKINNAKAEALIAAGRMQPAGLREVESAKADGRWESAYYGQRDITIPDDLQAALDASPAAKEMFGKLSGANRYAILYRVHDAKRPETRERRIREFVAMLERGETLHPQDPRRGRQERAG